MAIMEKNAESTGKTSRGYLLALSSAFVLSTTAICIRFLTETFAIPVLVLAFWRDLFAAMVLGIWLTLLQKDRLAIRRSAIPFLLLFGFILAVFNAMWTTAVALNGAAVATVLVYSSAAFTAILGWRLFKEPMNGIKVFAICLCLYGCVLVSGAFESAAWVLNFWGIVTGLLSGLCYAIYTLMGRSAARRGLNSWTILVYVFGFAAAFLLVFNIAGEGFVSSIETGSGGLFWLGDSVKGWLILFILAAGPTVIGFGLYTKSLTLLPSSVVNLVVTTEPVFTIMISFAVLGEILDGVQLIGSTAILAGVAFFRWDDRIQSAIYNFMNRKTSLMDK